MAANVSSLTNIKEAPGYDKEYVAMGVDASFRMYDLTVRDLVNEITRLRTALEEDYQKLRNIDEVSAS